MKKTGLKVGQSFDVITITAERPRFMHLMKKGDTGIVTMQYSNGNVSSFIGVNYLGDGDWIVSKGEFKKVGRLTITKIKKQ